MNNTLCTLAVATELKDLGYDRLTYHYYDKNGKLEYLEFPDEYNRSDQTIAVPTMYEALDWLFDKGVSIQILNRPNKKWHVMIYDVPKERLETEGDNVWYPHVVENEDRIVAINQALLLYLVQKTKF